MDFPRPRALEKIRAHPRKLTAPPLLRAVQVPLALSRASELQTQLMTASSELPQSFLGWLGD